MLGAFPQQPGQSISKANAEQGCTASQLAQRLLVAKPYSLPEKNIHAPLMRGHFQPLAKAARAPSPLESAGVHWQLGASLEAIAEPKCMAPTGPGPAMVWARSHPLQGFLLEKGRWVCQHRGCHQRWPGLCLLSPETMCPGTLAEGNSRCPASSLPHSPPPPPLTHEFGKPPLPCGETFPGWGRSDLDPSDGTRTGLGRKRRGRPLWHGVGTEHGSQGRWAARMGARELRALFPLPPRVRLLCALAQLITRAWGLIWGDAPHAQAQMTSLPPSPLKLA